MEDNTLETFYALTMVITLTLGLIARGLSSLLLPPPPARHRHVRDRPAHGKSAAASEMLAGRDPYSVIAWVSRPEAFSTHDRTSGPAQLRPGDWHSHILPIHLVLPDDIRTRQLTRPTRRVWYLPLLAYMATR